MKLTKIGVFEMPRGERIIMPFDRQFRAFGEAATLLSAACKRIATDSRNIPINFDAWPNVPTSYKDSCFNILRKLCRRNTEVRKKQTIPHTGGAKLLSTKQHEMEVELGRHVSRGELHITNHKKRDGSYVNEEANFIAGKMIQEMSQSVNSAQISIHDSVGKVLGKDHAGHVRCLGLGGLYSVAFDTTTSFSGAGCSFSSSEVENFQLKAEVVSLKNKLVTSDENFKTLKNVMLSYIQMKEGHIPSELGAMLNNTSHVVDEASEKHASTPKGGGSSLDSNVMELDIVFFIRHNML